MFLAAFSSLSCSVPQLKQSTERIDKSIFPHLKPQSEQTWLVGSHGLITLNSLPNFSDLAPARVLNSLHPCKLIEEESFRFLTIPDTAKQLS